MLDEPLVSLIMPTYNQERFIRDAFKSATSQTYHSLEIVISDDASPDATFAILSDEAAKYRGPHKLILNRNRTNLGLAANLNTAVALSRGELLVQQDGDDISFPERTRRLVRTWLDDTPRHDLVYSRALHIGPDGEILRRQNVPMRIATLSDIARGEFFVAGAAVSAYSRLLFEKFGPLNPAIVYTDYVLTFRALLGTGCRFIDEPLIYYRRHQDSITMSTANSPQTRATAARWAAHAVAEAEDRLGAWHTSRNGDRQLRRRLSRDLEHARLEWSSSTGSRVTALRCAFSALTKGMPRPAWSFVRRDVFNRT